MAPSSRAAPHQLRLGGAPQPVLLRGVTLGAGALAVLAARPLRAAAGRAAVDGLVAALVPLLRLGTILFEGRFAGVAAVSARRVEVLVLVMVSLGHRLPPLRVPRPARSPGSGNRHAGSGPMPRLLAPPSRAQIVQLPLTHAPSQLWSR